MRNTYIHTLLLHTYMPLYILTSILTYIHTVPISPRPPPHTNTHLETLIRSEDDSTHTHDMQIPLSNPRHFLKIGLGSKALLVESVLIVVIVMVVVGGILVCVGVGGQ